MNSQKGGFKRHTLGLVSPLVSVVLLRCVENPTSSTSHKTTVAFNVLVHGQARTAANCPFSDKFCSKILLLSTSYALKKNQLSLWNTRNDGTVM